MHKSVKEQLNTQTKYQNVWRRITAAEIKEERNAEKQKKQDEERKDEQIKKEEKKVRQKEGRRLDICRYMNRKVVCSADWLHWRVLQITLRASCLFDGVLYQRHLCRNFRKCSTYGETLAAASVVAFSGAFDVVLQTFSDLYFDYIIILLGLHKSRLSFDTLTSIITCY